jgi:hypothetical protein
LARLVSRSAVAEESDVLAAERALVGLLLHLLHGLALLLHHLLLKPHVRREVRVVGVHLRDEKKKGGGAGEGANQDMRCSKFRILRCK